MGWENRRNRQYFYTKRKVQGNKVVSEYVGGGYDGLLMAQLDQDARQKAKIRRKAWQTIKDRENTLDKRIDDITGAMNDCVTALLLVSGHHLHKRQWRKIRNDDR